MDIGTVALRGVVGPLFVGHGTQKLFGWFGGHGLEGTGGFFESLGLRPGRRHATAAGIAEALGGALLALGAATPIAASMVGGSMVTAVRKVHGPNGPWVTENGWEYPVLVIGALAALVEHGPGRPSVDDRLFPNWKGPFWATAMVATAVGGSYLIEATSEPAPEETASAGDAEVNAAAAEQAALHRDEAGQPGV